MKYKYVPVIVACHTYSRKNRKNWRDRNALWTIGCENLFEVIEIECEYVTSSLASRYKDKLPLSCDYHQNLYGRLHQCVVEEREDDGLGPFSCTEQLDGTLCLRSYGTKEYYELEDCEYRCPLSWTDVNFCPFCGYSVKEKSD